jgi:hypothetical protein
VRLGEEGSRGVRQQVWAIGSLSKARTTVDGSLETCEELFLFNIKGDDGRGRS